MFVQRLMFDNIAVPSPLVVALAPFECTVTPRDDRTGRLIMEEATSSPVPSNLESASVYNHLVAQWDSAEGRKG